MNLSNFQSEANDVLQQLGQLGSAGQAVAGFLQNISVPDLGGDGNADGGGDSFSPGRGTAIPHYSESSFGLRHPAGPDGQPRYFPSHPS